MKTPEKLIGKKVYGFRFEGGKGFNYLKSMDNLIDKIGIISSYNNVNNCYIVRFENISYSYPSDQIEAHLAGDKTFTFNANHYEMKLKDEIPTFTKEDLKTFYNIGFTNGVNKENKSSCLEFEKHFQDIFKPTKEEQLTAILGSSEKVSEIMELFKN